MMGTGLKDARVSLTGLPLITWDNLNTETIKKL